MTIWLVQYLKVVRINIVLRCYFTSECGWEGKEEGGGTATLLGLPILSECECYRQSAIRGKCHMTMTLTASYHKWHTNSESVMCAFEY